MSQVSASAYTTTRPPARLLDNLLATKELLYERTDWVHRQVQTAQFRNDFSVLLRVSLYLTLPPETLCGELAVPMAFCKKRRLCDLSLRDEVGKALPMLTFPRSILRRPR